MAGDGEDGEDGEDGGYIHMSSDGKVQRCDSIIRLFSHEQRARGRETGVHGESEVLPPREQLESRRLAAVAMAVAVHHRRICLSRHRHTNVFTMISH